MHTTVVVCLVRSRLSPPQPALSLLLSRRYQRRHPLISLATPPFFIFSLLKRQMDKVYCKVGSAPGKTVSEEERASEADGRIDLVRGRGRVEGDRGGERERERAERAKERHGDRRGCWLRVQLQLLRTLCWPAQRGRERERGRSQTGRRR